MTVFLAVPLVILVFNVLVIRELRTIETKSSASRRTSVVVVGGGGGGRSSSTKIPGSNTAAATTAMLLSVSFYVIVTTLPATLVYVLEEEYQHGPTNLTDAEIDGDERWQRYFRYITARKVVEEICLSHYACNVFLYLATGRQFRRTFVELVLRRCNRLSTAAAAAETRTTIRGGRFTIRATANGVGGCGTDNTTWEPPDNTTVPLHVDHDHEHAQSAHPLHRLAVTPIIDAHASTTRIGLLSMAS
jgi:hypothetical protein